MKLLVPAAVDATQQSALSASLLLTTARDGRLLFSLPTDTHGIIGPVVALLLSRGQEAIEVSWVAVACESKDRGEGYVDRRMESRMS